MGPDGVSVVCPFAPFFFEGLARLGPGTVTRAPSRRERASPIGRACAFRAFLEIWVDNG